MPDQNRVVEISGSERGITGGSDLPVAVIGAGPVGLAAAAHLIARGIRPLLLEASDRVGASVRDWGFVRLFSPWRHLVDDEARELLRGHGWREPDPARHPTGDELVRDYLEPLALVPAIAENLHLGHRVVSISRHGYDRMKSTGRGEAPFEVVVEREGVRQRFLARAVIDASGTWHQPNPLGSGVPAIGEEQSRGHIAYRIPDASGRDRERYRGRRVLVVGSGHSAQNALLDLARLFEEDGGELDWAIRGDFGGRLAGGGPDDQLPARASLGQGVADLVSNGRVRLHANFRLERMEASGGGVTVHAQDGRALVVDEIVALTGFRPDLEITRELRLELDPITEAPVRLAPLIDPNVHSCGTVPPHGQAELAHPEADLYLVGMKSYGRAPTFLLLTGYEQVRSVVAHLAGDHAAAREVRLALPHSGVCSGSEIGAACCGTAGEGESCDATATPSPAPDRGLAVVAAGGGCCA